MKFKVELHSIRPGVEVVEVFDDAGNFIAAIMQGDHPRQIKVVSKYMIDVRPAPPRLPLIPAVIIELAETPVVDL